MLRVGGSSHDRGLSPDRAAGALSEGGPRSTVQPVSRRLPTIALVALLVLVAAGCGSKKKTASSSPPPTASPSSSQSSSGSSGSNSSSGSNGSGSSGGASTFASTKNCVQLASLAAKVAQSVGTTSSGQVDLSKEADAIKALADAAPSEIKGDFRTFADAFAGYVKAYQDAGLQPGKTPTAAQIAKFATAARELSTPKVQAAISHLSTWSHTHCSGVGG